jgi:ABC-2 type transport system permease protein
MRAVALREFASYFRTPLGWVVLALFAFLSGVTFTESVLVPGSPASLRPFFGEWWGLLVVVCPAVSMRLLSEEHRTGTIEPLMTSPVGETAVVVGKFAAALAFLAVALLPALMFAGTLGVLSRPDYGPIVAGLFGLMLLGGLYLALGTLASALTASQTLAFLGTLFTLLLVEFGSTRLAPLLPAPLDRGVAGLSANVRMADFAKGVIDTAHVVYFVGFSALFLALAAVSLRVRRWR